MLRHPSRVFCKEADPFCPSAHTQATHIRREETASFGPSLHTTGRPVDLMPDTSTEGEGWIPHKILSILILHTCVKTHHLIQKKKDFQRLWHQIGANCGPDLLTSLSWPLPGKRGGDGVEVKF
uniref:Uncharacterized protein n=1 Tax=Eutreptiella gymnastica TaxID=73025 RepID=A0A7S4FPQ5_9EUGL|mmetsp:Transcript_9433/g.14509  ORF Transcript_9433/g.14509 Transcript_9433/m.14509 type:complete len:123 (+) Transcript_9433:324-692(+)